MVTPRGAVQRPVYIGVSLLMGTIAVVGFWPTYFGPLVRGTVEQPPVIHVHATVFVGWLVLFLAQVVLAATGRVAWHQRLGKLGIGYGIVIILVGLITTVLSTGTVSAIWLPLHGSDSSTAASAPHVSKNNKTPGSASAPVVVRKYYIRPLI